MPGSEGSWLPSIKHQQATGSPIFQWTPLNNNGERGGGEGGCLLGALGAGFDSTFGKSVFNFYETLPFVDCAYHVHRRAVSFQAEATPCEVPHRKTLASAPKGPTHKVCKRRTFSTATKSSHSFAAVAACTNILLIAMLWVAPATNLRRR